MLLVLLTGLAIGISGYFGCETWSLTLREEHTLNVFENTELRRIFGTKRNEMVEG
jgi:hypothetical protein